MKPRNIALQAFPDQARKLRPEHSAAGGVKARSGTEEQRMAVYRPIADMYLTLHPVCECGCWKPAREVHHKRGRDGLLLFDSRHFLAVCRVHHRRIHDNPAEAMRLGFMEEQCL